MYIFLYFSCVFSSLRSHGRRWTCFFEQSPAASASLVTWPWFWGSLFTCWQWLECNCLGGNHVKMLFTWLANQSTQQTYLIYSNKRHILNFPCVRCGAYSRAALIWKAHTSKTNYFTSIFHGLQANRNLAFITASGIPLWTFSTTLQSMSMSMSNSHTAIM